MVNVLFNSRMVSIGKINFDFRLALSPVFISVESVTSFPSFGRIPVKQKKASNVILATF